MQEKPASTPGSAAPGTAPRLEWGIRNGQPEDHLFATVTEANVRIQARVNPGPGGAAWQAQIRTGDKLYQPPDGTPAHDNLEGMIRWAEEHVQKERERIGSFADPKGQASSAAAQQVGECLESQAADSQG